MLQQELEMEEGTRIREMEMVEWPRDRREECMLPMIRAATAPPMQPNYSHPSQIHHYNPQPLSNLFTSPPPPILLLIIEMISVSCLTS